jgi:hypothetical protein
MKKTILTKMVTLVGLMLLDLSSYGQLPFDYLTKVSFHEKKTVSYSLPNQADFNCLTFRELAEYHGYMQFYKLDEYVDLDGEILLDKNFIEEYQVRDEWMESFSRITVGKNTLDVYDSEGSLFHQKPRIIDSSTLFLTPTEAANYKHLDLNIPYYDSLVVAYSNLGFVVTESNNVLTASSPDVIATYDHNLKIASATEFDSFGVKIKETTIEYALNHEEDTYFPETETIYEWIATDSGCCIRKLTVYKRYEFERELMQGSSTLLEKSNRLSNINQKSMIEVMTEANANAFRIVSKKHKNEIFDFAIYDMAGKLLLSGSTSEGGRVELPQGIRVGMYLVHVYTASEKTPTVKKIIKNNTSRTF